jgi:hypothetical protein
LHQTNCDSVDIMMIVSLTRGGLRDESHMADEAFALSPISARATLPSEEDYEAISQAFMETSRGRWFLGEYAKRNRNADTRMVLDAVARIEQTVTAQKQAAEQAASETRLSEALAPIRRAVYEAQAAAAVAVQNLGLEENLAPVRKGSRIIKEISWRWREIGADSRICDLLDSQVAAIDDACGQISSTSPEAALIAAFDLIKAQIAASDDSDTAARQAAEAAAPRPSSAVSDAMPARAVETMWETSAGMDRPAEAAVETAETLEASAEVIETTKEAADATAEVADMAAENLDVPPETAGENAEATDAYDEALLDMVALEMAAPDPADIDDAPSAIADEIQTDETRAMESPPAEPIIVAEKPEPPAAPEPPAFQPPLQPSLEPAPRPVVEPSLGSTLLASGILHKPKPAASDPLAPIRRMSQAEKIAFFS